MSFIRHVRLRVPAAAARPGPAIGQALGPLGINMAEFCKQFNAKSESIGYEKETPLRVRLSAFSDRSFKFEINSPPTTYLIKQCLGITGKGATDPDISRPFATIAPEAIYEIAKIKQQDNNRWHIPLESIARSVIGTCRSMGIIVKEEEPEENLKKE